MGRTIEEWADKLFVPLYKERYIQTLWNTESLVKQTEGWELKGGKWSPWFFNMRPVGSSAELFCDIGLAMADLVLDHEVDIFIALEMAGINLSGGMAVASLLNHSIGRPIGYTRPLPIKVRKPLEALKLLKEIESGSGDQRAKNLETAINLFKKLAPSDKTVQKTLKEGISLLKQIIINTVDYGQKEYVEARLFNGYRVGIYDDVATTLGSKIIARLIVLWEAKHRGLSVECNKIFYFLNRNPENRQVGLDFANESEPELFPEALDVYYIIEFNDHLPGLQPYMRGAEHEVISEFQKNSGHFQDEDVRKEVLALAAKTR